MPEDWSGWPDGHYYSPVPSAEDVTRALGWASAADLTDLPAIDVDVAGQWKLLDEVVPVAREVGPGRRWPSDSGFFGVADATIYRGIVAQHRPARILELGVGHSTAVALDVAEALDLPTVVHAVDPDLARLEAWAMEDIEAGHLVVRRGVAQDVRPEEVSGLAADDILFIDSSHVGKAGSDVLHEIFRLLPATAPGVLVHVHDIFPGFEYPRRWMVEERRYWNEAYLLRAFLMFNSAFEIVLWQAMLSRDDRERMHRQHPELVPPGASIWLRRTGH
jgi:Methyltransferase domain